jgi:hypothetical protein
VVPTGGAKFLEKHYGRTHACTELVTESLLELLVAAKKKSGTRNMSTRFVKSRHIYNVHSYKLLL